LTQPSISKSEDKEEIEIDITDDDHAWVERIVKQRIRYVMIRLAIA